MEGTWSRREGMSTGVSTGMSEYMYMRHGRKALRPGGSTKYSAWGKYRACTRAAAGLVIGTGETARFGGRLMKTLLQHQAGELRFSVSVVGPRREKKALRYSIRV